MANLKINLLDYIGDCSALFDAPGCSAKAFIDTLDAFPESDEIDVSIGSNGGDVDEGLVMYNSLIGSGKTVNVTILANARSIAAIIAMAASPGRLKAFKNARIMIHPAWGRTEGNAKVHRERAEQMEKISNEMFSIILERRGDKLKIDQAKLREYFEQEKDITASEALAFGLIDEIINSAQMLEYADSQKAYAFFKSTPADTPAPTPSPVMKKTQASFLARLQQASQAFATAIAGGILNASAPLKEGGLVYFEGDLAEGTVIYSDEAMTAPVADAEHVLEDGRKVTTVSGAVTAIAEAASADEPNAEVVALKAQVADLQTQLAAANAAKEAAIQAQAAVKTEKETALNNLKKLETSFNALKAEWQGDNDKGDPKPTQHQTSDTLSQRASSILAFVRDARN